MCLKQTVILWVLLNPLLSLLLRFLSLFSLRVEDCTCVSCKVPTSQDLDGYVCFWAVLLNDSKENLHQISWMPLVLAVCILLWFSLKIFTFFLIVIFWKRKSSYSVWYEWKKGIGGWYITLQRKILWDFCSTSLALGKLLKWWVWNFAHSFRITNERWVSL